MGWGFGGRDGKALKEEGIVSLMKTEGVLGVEEDSPCPSPVLGVGECGLESSPTEEACGVSEGGLEWGTSGKAGRGNAPGTPGGRWGGQGPAMGGKGRHRLMVWEEGLRRNEITQSLPRGHARGSYFLNQTFI